ncbi:MAG: PQQ-dependent dehydrogenase, methanol/ethanol family [Woeseiaceae bacterium]|nr:PQQ-dependent dehydrogenase, methanol/ethanol family [Woeseiaceae bacterium]
MKPGNSLFLLIVCLVAAACSRDSGVSGEPGPDAVVDAAGPPVTDVVAARIVGADGEAWNWLSHGRTYDEQRFSPLSDIDATNVTDLGLAWYFDVPTSRGMEATPIVVDGRMYVTGAWSIVYALDAATGEELWRYDPEVPKAWAQYACCDVVNRGVAVWGDSVFVGTLDGYLVSLDAASGDVRWRVDTIDRKPPYTITGAPRVVKGRVIIGNGGADLGVRGYISAYDAGSGELDWRFYTVPGNPADGFENETLENAAKTWTGEWWTYGGGGTVWDSMAYDPELDLLYFGVGNGSPWDRDVRSPDGGDNLFLSSIVAVRPDTGEYAWHYQTTPGDTWDFTATQHIILADLVIDDETRKVLMQAPKNGFFYVIDRATGEFIDADPFVKVTWATGIDKDTGRPDEVPGARYENEPFVMMPTGFGGHNWHPMAYSPRTGLVYIPAQDLPAVYMKEPDFEFTPGFWNTGTEFELLHLPDDPEVVAEILASMTGQIVAWDPVAQQPAWQYRHAGAWNGGMLATAGDLVFQGSLIGEFAAYDAATGERVWQYPVHTGIAAAPISYAVDGRQHIAVAAGFGTLAPMFGGKPLAAANLRNYSRILAFTNGGNAALPAPTARARGPVPEPPASVADDATLAAGKDNYYERCVNCHGMDVASGGVLPDLRYASHDTFAAWDAIVLGGAYRDKGMPAFGEIFSKDDSDAIKAFVIAEARKARVAGAQ